MSRSFAAASAAIVVLLLALMTGNFKSFAQATAGSDTAKAPNHFEIDVIETFNAKYQGDTPGHIARGGKLEGQRPNVALGDGVYRGDSRIGSITKATWDRARGSLDIEFDTNANERIAVGDSIWLYLDGTKTAK